MWSRAWAFLREKGSRAWLGLIGGGLVVLAGGLWKPQRVWSDSPAIWQDLHARYDKFYAEGRDKGVNSSLEAAIDIAKREVALSHGPDQRGTALNDLGLALWRLGERESGTQRLEEAVAAFRAALEDGTRERVPVDWAKVNWGLGDALLVLGERESGTEKIERAIKAYRAALEELTEKAAPYWHNIVQKN